MQIGIDLGATKIESVLLKENGLELHRDRIQSPKNYQKTIQNVVFVQGANFQKCSQSYQSQKHMGLDWMDWHEY